MPRPKNKIELENLSEKKFQSIFKIIENLSEQKRKDSYSFEHRDKNLRDTLAHLHHWHLLFLNWYQIGMNGKKPSIPEKGFTWKTLPLLNQKIWEKYQTVTLEEVIFLLKESHERLKKIILSHNDNELFTKKYYHWTGTTSLGSYIISSTSSHYDWALKWIKKHQKTNKRTI